MIVPMQRLKIVAPTRVFLVVMLTVFATEAMIMLGPLARHPFSGEAVRMAMVDSLTLVAVLCPVVWLTVVRPLRDLSHQRGRLLRRLFEVQEVERARLARDLHDEIGQNQTAILLGLRALLGATDLEKAREQARVIYDISSRAIDATRRLARGLSPAILADFGIAQALAGLCEDLQAATDIEVSFHAESGLPQLGAEGEVALFRMAQEALTNAVRHAQATRIEVELERSSDRTVLRVTDDGKGLRAEPRGDGAFGLGLAGMRERARLLGGTFRIGPGPGEGTVVEVELPSERTPGA